MALSLPAQDLTVHVLAFTPTDTVQAIVSPASVVPELSVVMTRQSVDATQRLDALVGQQLDTLANTLKEYQFVRRFPLFLDEREAEQVEYTWQAQNGMVYQWQVTVFCAAQGGAQTGLQSGSRIALTLTATTLHTLQGKYDFAFQQMLYSLRFRR